MLYHWDDEKDRANRNRHGMSLAEGIPALQDPDALFRIDDRFDYGEERIITLGRAGARVLYVVTTELRDDVTRIISGEERRRMKKGRTTRIRHEPGDPPIVTDTDWNKVDAMTDEEIHAAALADPDAQPLSAGDQSRLRAVVNVKKLRERLGITQEEFASRYRIPLGTLRDWEQRRKFPDAPARAYLHTIEKAPDQIASLIAG
jgi:putative transcriptional regulator